MAISYNAGSNLITLTGSGASPAGGTSWGNAYDMEDVLAQCGAVVTKQGANAYDVSARMLFDSSVYFVSKNEFVELKPNPTNPSYTIRTESSTHIKFGEYNTTDKYSYDGAFWRIYVNANSGSQTNRINGELLIYGSSIWTDTGNYPKGLHFVAGAKIRLYNSIHRHPSYFWAVDTDIQNVKWDGTGGSYDMLVASGPNFNWAGLTTSACQKGIFFSSTTTSSVDVYDFKPLNAGTDVYVSTGINSAHLIRIINSPLAITCSNPGAGKQGVQFCYTFNVKVTNDVGTPIVGATVSLKDVDGNDAFSPVQTVSGGVLPNDEIVKWYWFRNAADGGNKDYNDHTLKVVNGADETEYKIKIDHQIKEDVILIPQSTASYDNIMTAISDIKGTGFVKDTDSLVDIRPETDKIQTGIISTPDTFKANVSNLDVAVSTRNATTPPTVGEIKTELEAAGTKLTTVKDQTDKMHFSGNNIQARAADKGVLNNPPSEAIADYKATGFATENPPSQVLNDYKATGFATENPPSQVLDDYKADVSALEDILGISGENTVWSAITHNADHNITAATITQYTNNALTVVKKVWSFTASYNVDGELTAHELVEA